MDLMKPKSNVYNKNFVDKYCTNCVCFIGTDSNKICAGLWKCAFFSTELDFMLSKLEADKAELVEAFKELLGDAKYYYKYYPNNWRYTEEENFKEQNQLIQKMESGE